jgi:hypothetical protein
MLPSTYGRAYVARLIIDALIPPSAEEAISLYDHAAIDRIDRLY